MSKWHARSRASPATRHAIAPTGASTTGELAAGTPLLLLEQPLPGGEPRARLAPRAARRRLEVVEAVLGQQRGDRAVDGGDVVGIGRRRVGHQRARHRAQGDDERVDAHLDRAAAAVLDQLAPLAHPEDDVRGDPAPPEDLHGTLPGAEVALDAALRLARRDPREDLGVEGLDVDADGVDAGAVYLLEDRQVVGRLKLHLDRHAAAALLDRRG